MKRRHFVFGSLLSAGLFGPLLSRRAEAEGDLPRRLFVYINPAGYPRAEDFFPSGDSFEATPILGALEPVADQLTIVDGINIQGPGVRPRGNNHVASVGKLLTAIDVVDIGNDDGEPNGPSVDHLIGEARGLRSIHVNVSDRGSTNMRSRPFASGARRFNLPLISPAQVWQSLFRDFDPNPDAASREAFRHRLLARRSILDGLSSEVRRLRMELVSVERAKLEVLEDSIRRAENSVADDLVALDDESSRNRCEVPGMPSDSRQIPDMSRAHFDVMHAALVCDRAQIGGLMFGFSGYKWRYSEWLDLSYPGNIHDDVHHKASERRNEYNAAARWDWEQFGAFVARLRDTPDLEGNMLDSSVVVGMSHFGRHHRVERIPFVLAGNACGRLQPGRVIRVPDGTFNDKALTSIAHLMGVPLAGIGADANCGPLEELYSMSS